MTSSIARFPKELVLHTMSYLDNKDRAAVRKTNKRYRILSWQKESSNLPSRIEKCLRFYLQELPCAYMSNALQGHADLNRPLTMERMVGDYLVILSHPSSDLRFLQVINLQKTILNQRTDPKEFLVNARVDTRIEACEITNGREPALILANYEEGVRRLVLNQLFSNPPQTQLCFRDLPILAPAALGEARLSMAPNHVDREEADQHLEAQDYSPVLCAQDSLVAIGYDRFVNFLKDGTQILLPFWNARKITIQDQKLICVSQNECAIWRLDQPLTETSPPYFYTRQDNGEPPFKFAKICASKVVIAYRRAYIFHGPEQTLLLGAICDRQTTQKEWLMMNPFHDDSTLNAIEEIGGYIFGTLPNQLIRWDLTGFNAQLMASINQIHTMITVGRYILIGGRSDFGLMSAPNGTWESPYRMGLLAGDLSLSAQRSGKYLILTSQRMEGSRYEVKAFTLDPPKRTPGLYLL